jgi:transglutaminase-like putative cysteine protease
MRDSAGDPTFSPPVARTIAFMALALFGALHWMVLLEPSASGRAWALAAVAGLIIAGLLGAGRLSGRRRIAAAWAVALVGSTLALLAGGVPDELLAPDRWGDLAAGISRGIESLPGVRVPYRGLDEWTRTVIPLGASALIVVAALLAFWPRRRGLGFPLVALVVLVALYAVPAVALIFPGEFLRGALLALLVLAFLRLEKLRMSEATAAAGLAVGVVVFALALAPALDGDEPWWDYETWALEAATAKSTTFSWDHSYGPLDWPRDGRELLRVRMERPGQPSYWKASNLDTFDGTRWVRQGVGFEGEPETRNIDAAVRWTQDIRVSVRNLRTPVFITAGEAEDVDIPNATDIPTGDGLFRSTRILKRGDAYTATIYDPHPSSAQRERATASFSRELAPYRRFFIRKPQTGAPPFQVDVFPFPTAVRPLVRPNESAQAEPELYEELTSGPLARTWQLAQELKNSATTQEGFVQAVLRHLDDGYAYTESPDPQASTIEGFLFDAREGYCQHFSGAMALLLRMGGVPARVVTGFTTGSLDRKSREFVVRDLDAHSWVEVWYEEYGWVTFDPTPAVAPARSQPNEEGSSGGPAGLPRSPEFGSGDLPSDPGRRAAATTASTPWWEIALFAVLGTAALVLLVLIVRRHRARRPPAALAPLLELERALRRMRRPPAPGTTLRAIEGGFAGSPAAAGYVRAVRELRFGSRAAPPTAAQRRGLRSELARGGGLVSRLRAWWALPPRAR